MATWVSGEWYKVEWPIPSWDDGNKWRPADHCWRLTHDGLYFFTVVAGAVVIDVAVNDYVKIMLAITLGDPDEGAEIIAAGTDIVSSDFTLTEFSVSGWKRLRAGTDVYTYAGQISARNREITFIPQSTDYFNYARMGPYPA